MSKRDEKGLIEAARMGDGRAFETLVGRYQKPVYNVAYRMLRDPEEARDVTQTVFLKTFENLHRFDPTRRFFSWICRIAINESIDRKAAHREQTGLDGHDEDSGSSTEDAIGQRELNQGLEEALMTLSAEHRSVVILKHILGMSYQEIGETLELPEKTVKSRLFSARQNLRDRLKGSDYL